MSRKGRGESEEKEKRTMKRFKDGEIKRKHRDGNG